ncbi:MAG: hypothetical protein JWR54_1303 [Mucilaginibacter sp.]|nr:hypothetical protein [Mucilaginibacter sp.]
MPEYVYTSSLDLRHSCSVLNKKGAPVQSTGTPYQSLTLIKLFYYSVVMFLAVYGKGCLNYIIVVLVLEYKFSNRFN